MAKGFKTGGRKPGSVNKMTADVKAAVVAAFDRVGGADYLSRQAEQNPQAFMTLLGKVLPLQIGGDKDNPVELVFRWKS